MRYTKRICSEDLPQGILFSSSVAFATTTFMLFYMLRSCMDISQRVSLAKKKKKEWACWSYEFLKVLKVGDKDPRSEEIESLSKIAATYFFLHNMPFELKQSWEKCLAAFFLSFFLFKPDIIAVMPTGRRVKQAYFQNILECSASIW